MKAWALAATLLAIVQGAAGAPALAQEPSPEQLQQQIADMEAQLAALRLRQSKARLAALRQEVAALEADLGQAAAPAVADPAPGPAAAEVPAKGAQAAADAPGRDFSQPALRDEDSGKQKFGGIEFGVGIAFTHDLGNNRRIKEAELVNGLVRITDEENLRARIVLESHYFFTPRSFNLLGVKNKGSFQPRLDENGRIALDKSNRPLLDYVPDNNIGIGPFMAFQPGTDNIIEGIGAGVMIGMRRPGKESSESFNIGIGVLYDLNTRLLGEGLTRNQPLPNGETAIRYRETSQSGLLIMTSYSF